MTDERDFDRLARAWLELGSDEAPDRVLAAVLQAVEVTPQVRRPLRWPIWRSFKMNRVSQAAGAVGVLAIVVIGGGLLLNQRDQPAAGGPATTATPSAAPTASPSPITYAGIFGPTGPMANARTGDTKTLLPDGRVLVAGGFGGLGASLSSAELYDPESGTFSPTGPLATARYWASATLLPGGRVLVAGGFTGFGGGASLSSAELYDPASGTFSPTGPMSTARALTSATLLPDGRVLIAGGEQGGIAGQEGTALSSAELYDPASGTRSE